MPLSRNSRRGLKYSPRKSGWNVGEAHGNSKLTVDDVLRIRQLIAEEELSFADIAKAFRVTTGTISHIHTGRLWKHVPGLKSPEESDLGVLDDADPGDS